MILHPGLSRLAEAFRPLLGSNLRMGREIEKVEHIPENDGKVKLLWKRRPADIQLQSETYDYAIISAPFAVVRRWRLPSEFES